MKESIVQKINSWVNERIPLAKFINEGLHEEIVGGSRFSYTLGSTCLFLLIIQFVTGLWHMFFYVPTVDYAYSSLSYLRFHVPFGWLIHGLHYWGAHLFTIVVGLHCMRVFIWGAYKKPREIVWLAGVFIILMVVGFMFTGPVLAWDKKGFWAGQVGLGIAGSVPIVGPWQQHFLQGAAQMGQIALSRLFVIHVAVIPMLILAFVGLHLIAFRQHLSVGPWDEKKRQARGSFWPEQLFKDIVVWLVVFLFLLFLCAYYPPHVTGKADPMDTLYPPKPEWNFFFLYEIIKYFPGPFLPIGTAGIPTLILLGFLSLPFLDRSPERNPFKRGFVVLTFMAFVGAVLFFTYLGWKAHPPAPEVIAVMDEKDQKKEVRHSGHQPKENMQVINEVNSDDTITGEKLFNRLGCTECHTANGSVSSKQGPDLLMTQANKRTREWMHLQIRYPQEHNKATIMPPYNHLSEKNVNLLIDYLESLKPSANAVVKSVNSVVEQAANLTPEQIALIKEGEDLVNAQGCTQCHTVKGRMSTKSGPDFILAMINEKRSKDWLTDQIKNPQSHNPNSIMPSYAARLSDAQINAITEFLSSLSTRKINAGGSALGSTEDEDVGSAVGEAASIVGNKEHGSVLYQQSCIMCHGPQGKTNALNHTKEKGVPSLNPIRENLRDEDPLEFAKRIDPFIQHGMKNNGGGRNMPAFGDTHGLTQAQIADIEAYVMHLNGVDRAKIMNPGIEPKAFFWIIFNITMTLVLLSVLYWIMMKRKI